MRLSKKALWRAAKWGIPVFLSVTLLIIFLAAGSISRRRDTPEFRTISFMNALNVAYEAFKEDNGSYPVETENYRLVKIFGGENSKKIEFLRLNSNFTNANWEFIDGWKTPLRFGFKKGLPLIISAGADKVFGTADDITNQDEN